MLRRLNAAPLAVAPELAGCPLASPLRRGIALALDTALLLLPTLAVAIGAAALALQIEDPTALQAMSGLMRGTEQRERLLADLGPMLLRVEAPGLPPEAAAAFARGDASAGARLLAGHDFVIALRADAGEAELRPGQVLVPIERLIPSTVRTAAIFGVPALYFTLLTARSRRTLGKRLLGIRVARLDGRPLTPWESFERFGGYFAVPGTLGLGLLELWREPNRRLAHDRGAETVVVLEKDPPSGRSAAEKAPPSGRSLSEKAPPPGRSLAATSTPARPAGTPTPGSRGATPTPAPRAGARGR